MKTMKQRYALPAVAIVFAALGLPIDPIFAQPSFQIMEIGLTGSEHTRNDGYKYSSVDQQSSGGLNEAGKAIGVSQRFDGGSTDLGYSTWLYDGTNTVKIGLTDNEHTRGDGYKLSAVHQLNEAGQALGRSNRYGGGFLGDSAWLYNGITTINIGLTGVEHTRDDGYKWSQGYQLNGSGQVVGNSNRFDGNADWGYSAWLYDGNITTAIGLTGSENIRNDGYMASVAYLLNDAGQVGGYSQRFNGSADLGYSAWVYNGSNYIDIGLTDGVHTRDDGYTESFGTQLNKTGQVSGLSARFSGSTNLGYSNWLYDGTNTVKIGLSGVEHTRSDGYMNGSNYQLNETGQVLGLSTRYDGGSTDLGQSIWLYNGSSTINIGFNDGEHTRNDGYKLSYSDRLNEAGQVSGVSHRFSGNTYFGQSAWLYNGTVTINVGLTDYEHTRNDGYKLSYIAGLNEAGRVIGGSNRYSSGSDNGRSAWLYNGSSTIEIGLTGSEHTRDDGYRFSAGTLITNSGYVIGSSSRFDGSDNRGVDAWVYHDSLGTVKLQLSVSEWDGYAESQADFVSENGIVLGSYYLLNGPNQGRRAFYWSASEGMLDLGSLIEGGLFSNGWESLYTAIQRNGLGQIIGNGWASGSLAGSQSVFVLTAIPEPSAATLVLAGMLVPMILTGRRRR